MHCIMITEVAVTSKMHTATHPGRLAGDKVVMDGKKLAIPVAREFLSRGSWPALSSAAGGHHPSGFFCERLVVIGIRIQVKA